MLVVEENDDDDDEEHHNHKERERDVLLFETQNPKQKTDIFSFIIEFTYTQTKKMATTANVDVSAPKPKVNGELMETFSGKSVQLVLEKTSEHPLKGKASDGMEVSVDASSVAGGVPTSRFIEVEGVVTGRGEIKATNVASFGENVDLFAYNEMCKMLHSKGREMIL